MLLIKSVFVLSVTIRLTFWIFFGLALAFKRRKANPENGLNPCSVIICSHNELNNLQELLPQLIQQKHPDFETIIVDDRSTDGTISFLEERQATFKNLKIIRIDKTPFSFNPKKYALLQGIKEAQNDILIFTDADCRPASKHWITSVSSAFDPDTKIILGLSPYFKMPGFLSRLVNTETLFTAIQYISMTLAGNPYMGVGRNLAYRKSFFVEKKGFGANQSVLGGDDDLFVNMHGTSHNTKILFDPLSKVYSKPKRTFHSYFLQKKRHLSVGKHYKTKDKIWLSLFSISNLSFWLTFILMVLWATKSWVLFVIGSLIILWMVISIIFAIYGKQTQEKVTLWFIPFFDLFLTFYYAVIGLTALTSRKITWS